MQDGSHDSNIYILLLLPGLPSVVVPVVLLVWGCLHPGHHDAARDGIAMSHLRAVNRGLLTPLFISIHDQGTARHSFTRDWRLCAEWIPGVVYLALLNQGEPEV